MRTAPAASSCESPSAAAIRLFPFWKSTPSRSIYRSPPPPACGEGSPRLRPVRKYSQYVRTHPPHFPATAPPRPEYLNIRSKSIPQNTHISGSTLFFKIFRRRRKRQYPKRILRSRPQAVFLSAAEDIGLYGRMILIKNSARSLMRVQLMRADRIIVDIRRVLQVFPAKACTPSAWNSACGFLAFTSAAIRSTSFFAPVSLFTCITLTSAVFSFTAPRPLPAIPRRSCSFERM